LWVAAPPSIPEQDAIADYIDIRVAKLDELRTQVQSAMDVLAEYRSTLITKAVTGQIAEPL
jgi:ribosomal protein L10